jgi:hypothetical protein
MTIIGTITGPKAGWTRIRDAIATRFGCAVEVSEWRNAGGYVRGNLAVNVSKPRVVRDVRMYAEGLLAASGATFDDP